MVFEGQPWGIVPLAWLYSVWKDPRISWPLPKSPSAPSHDPNVQPSRWPSLNKGASSAYIVASAKNGKYREVASLHMPILKARATSKERAELEGR